MMDKIELLEKLRNVDEVTLMEVLGITSDDLVDAFLDKINAKLTWLYKQFNED